MTIKLKAARVDKDMTQEELARAVGVTKKTINSWEAGKTMPKLDKIERLCSVLGRKYDEIRWTF